MLKETITYEDFNGVERTEDFYFNLTKAELVELEMGISGGLTEMINRIVAANDAPSIIKTFKELVLKAYGVKSPDGKFMDKSEQVKKEFEQSQAYSELFMKLAFDAEAGAAFVNGIIPKDLAKSLSEVPASN